MGSLHPSCWGVYVRMHVAWSPALCHRERWTALPLPQLTGTSEKSFFTEKGDHPPRSQTNPAVMCRRHREVSKIFVSSVLRNLLVNHSAANLTIRNAGNDPSHNPGAPGPCAAPLLLSQGRYGASGFPGKDTEAQRASAQGTF